MSFKIIVDGMRTLQSVTKSAVCTLIYMDQFV